ncbi:MAG: kelch repeat-containing protein [Anaerolineales bacterium]|jgi:N-acetylneuraminic acid mutarotase
MKTKFYTKLKRYTHIIIVSISLGLLFIPVKAQHTPWTQKADMETGRHTAVASAVDGKIYVIGGRYSETQVSEYDPASDTWTTKYSMPTFRMVHSGIALNGKIYIMGGIPTPFVPALTTVEEYEPVSDTWATKTPMLTPRIGHCTSVVDGKIYVIGGMTSGPSFWEGMRDTVEIYDPVTDSWSIGASIPTERAYFTTSVVDGKIYAIGGDLVTMEDISSVEMYNPVTNTWTTKSPMPTARAGHVSAVVDGIIYIIGGGTHEADPGGYSVVEAYDPSTDTWTTMADIPEKRALACADTIDGKIYVFGGISTFSDPHLHGTTTVYVYDPSKDLAGSIDQMYLNRCFAEAGNDSVCISTKVNDPTGLTLFAAIKSSNQAIMDSIQLFDDGQHNDGDAGDNIFANVWPVDAEDEQHYYVDLHITKEGEETIIHHMKNMASFTTIGPVVYEGIKFSASDSVPNPGDLLKIKVSLRNESSLATAPNVRVRISSTDPMVNVLSNSYFPLGDIESQSINTTTSYITIKIADDCPVNSEIIFSAKIMSEDISYCTDNFTIQVVDPASGTGNENVQTNQIIQIQNYPNPFSQTSTIRFNLPESGFATLRIYDFLGREIETLISDFLITGDHSVEINAIGLAEGIYFCRLATGALAVTKKIVLVR